MTDTIKPKGYLIDWPDEPDLGYSLEEVPCGPELGRCEALYAAADVAALVRQMRDVMRDLCACHDEPDCCAVQMGREAIAAADAFLSQQEVE